MHKTKQERNWTLGGSLTNCGSERCRMGCWDKDIGAVTSNKPHGPYYTLFRRRTDSDTNPIHEKFRIGKVEPTREQMGRINASIRYHIPARVWNDKDARRELVKNMRSVVDGVLNE